MFQEAQVESLLALVIGTIVGGGISFATSYFLNLQNYKCDIEKQASEHSHNLTKQKSEHNYERQIFLRQKYEELSFRIIDFTNILKELSLRLSQEGSETSIDTNEFGEKGAKIEIITVLYFPELINDCEDFLLASNHFLIAHDTNNQDIDSFNSSKIRFDRAFDKLYDQIKKQISDYT